MNGTRVLVIDDEEMVCASLTAYLEDIGCQVLQAANGNEGLEVFFRERPDLVLTDLRMPVLDGFAVVERLTREAPETPVIVVSGIGSISEAIRAIHLGAWDYLTKPVEDMDELEITARRVLERTRLLQENRLYRQHLEEQVDQRTRQLGESEQRFHQLFLQHEDAIVLCRGADLEIFDINPAACAMFGYSAQDLAQGGLGLIISPEELPLVSLGLTEAPDDAAFLRERVAAMTRDGSELVISFKGWRILFDNSAMYYCSIRDMSEKISAEEESRANHTRLIQANKMSSLGFLVSGMAHEINNPNNFIRVNAALLDDIWRDTRPVLEALAAQDDGITLGGLALSDAAETGARLIDGIARGSERISAVVKGLKDFSRADTAGLDGNVDICRVIVDVRMILDHLIQAGTDRFQVCCPDRLPIIRGNHQQIEQVLINLLTNALQALPDRNHCVRIVAGHDPATDDVLFSVIDDGAGMAPDILAKLTEPFFSTRVAEGGTGLGLSICNSIIRDHGGTLSFVSEPGRGTTATVRLPVAV
jgi:PAS domain S-box-containing protein